MVQQVSLVATIPESQHGVLRITLESLTGMKPQDLSQHTVILKPKFPFNPEQRAGKINQIESYRIRMTRVWEDEGGHDKGNSILSFDNNKIIKDDSIWTLQLSDIPAAGKRSVSIQNMYESTIYKSDDAFGYVDELGYVPEAEYWNKGLRFYYNDIIIEIYRLFVKLSGKSKEKQEADSMEIDDNVDKSNESSLKSEQEVELRLLDGSGQYQVKCYINVSKLNDLDNVARSVKQLESLKAELAGLIELDIYDRISMDSRVNSRIASNNNTSNNSVRR